MSNAKKDRAAYNREYQNRNRARLNAYYRAKWRERRGLDPETGAWTCPRCGQVFKTAGGHAKFCGRNWDPVFWSKVRKTGTCWLWTGGCTYAGHGQFNISMTIPGTKSNAKMLAHRYSWERVNGPVPEGLCVLHKCDVPNCVRPDHLFIGTQQENMQDAARKGRMWRGGNRPKSAVAE